MAATSFVRHRARRALYPVSEVRRLQVLAQSNTIRALAPAYEGATRKRTQKDWNATDISADAALEESLPDIRAKTREQVRNNPIARAITDVLTDYAVGTGLTPWSKVDHEAIGITLDQAIEWGMSCERYFERAAPHLDMRGTTDFVGLQRLVCRREIEDGESFAMLPLVDLPGRPLKTAVDVIEGDRIDTPQGIGRDENVRMGVVLGRYAQPVAYYVFLQHPGDSFWQPLSRSRKWQKVLAWQDGRRVMLHVYDVQRGGQSRGEPLFASSISPLYDLKKYDDAELIAARVAACFSVLIKRMDPAAALDAETEERGDVYPVEQLEPGMVERLKPGEDVAVVNPSRPNTATISYIEGKLKLISASTGLPLMLVLKDFSKSNFSNTRAASNEAYRAVLVRRRRVVHRFAHPVWQAVIDEGVATGVLAPPVDYEEFRDSLTFARWIGPGRGYVDPVKEVQAARDAIDAGLSTLQDECALLGKDWEEVMEQRAREIARAKELGLEVAPKPPPVPGAPPKPGADDDDDEDETEDDDDDR